MEISSPSAAVPVHMHAQGSESRCTCESLNQQQEARVEDIFHTGAYEVLVPSLIYSASFCAAPMRLSSGEA